MIRLLFLSLLLVSPISQAETTTVPEAKDFFTDAQQAVKNKTPILILFSTPDCPYCEEIKQEVIGPMSELEEYQQKIIIRHVDESSFSDVQDFYNNSITMRRLGFNYAVDFFPTVILVDNNGTPLDKIIGVKNLEYYWHELDQIIDQAIRTLKLQLARLWV